MRRPLSAIVILLALAAAAPRADVFLDPDGIVSVETRAPVDSVTVGQRFDVHYAFTYPDSLRMVEHGDFTLDKSRVLSTRWSETSKDGKTTRRADLTVVTLDLDGADIPQQGVDFVTPSGDTILAFTREATVPVKLIATDSTGLRALKSQWEAPRSYVAWIAAGAAALVLAALLIWYWRRRRARPDVAPPVPAMPPDHIALTELSRIERLGLVDCGEFKEYYTLVVDAVRRYLEGRFGVEAMERTSDEVLGDLEARRVTVDGLEGLFRDADLVKFARFTPAAEQARGAITRAREVVAKTAPRHNPALAAEDETSKEQVG